MSKFHTTLSRRQFMKGLGLGAAGLGAAAASVPVFHDLDELISSPEICKEMKPPWWVKRVDKPPTDCLEIDYATVVRSDKDLGDSGGHNGIPYEDRLYSPSADKYDSPYRPRAAERLKELVPEWKGDSLRDVALNLMARNTRFPGGPFAGITKMPNPSIIDENRTIDGPQLGAAKWEGTPEENSRMIRNVMKLVGSPDIGFLKLDDNTRKFFWRSRSRKEIVFEDVPLGYESDDKYVIPYGFDTVINNMWVAPTQVALRWPSLFADGGKWVGSSRKDEGTAKLLAFLRGIGYQGLDCNSKCNSEPIVILSGCGEHTRMCNSVISPEFGGVTRHTSRIVTNLPLAHTGPVDGGVSRFCNTCGICADVACAFDALPRLDGTSRYGSDRSWDPGIIQGSAPGFYGWRLDVARCSHCGSACQGICPFYTTKKSWIHYLVAAVSSKTTLFNGFFANMEEAFGYGIKNPETWWTMDNEPAFGVDYQFLSR